METNLNLGPIKKRTDVRSSLGPFQILPEYRITYSQVVVEALGELYVEYNSAFAPLVEKNREWETDYQFCMLDGRPVNWAVQIDMVGLSQEFLDATATMTVSQVREILRQQIFEIENSLAMYSLLQGGFADETGSSFFKIRFRTALEALRKRFGKQIVLFAVTSPKFRAMQKSEFGHEGNGHLTHDVVHEISGFDMFWGVHECRQNIRRLNDCQHLLYARTSDPVQRLINPYHPVEHPILGDASMRRVVKANALTFNIDDPSWSACDRRRINDTKGYMAPMRMAHEIIGIADLKSLPFSPEKVVRAKPVKGTYGCYGHVRGKVTDVGFNDELRRNLSMRGPYVVQPELDTPIVTNTTNGIAYTYIDRNFLTIADGTPRFIGGFRNLIPLKSQEARMGRIHGNSLAVWAEIVC